MFSNDNEWDVFAIPVFTKDNFFEFQHYLMQASVGQMQVRCPLVDGKLNSKKVLWIIRVEPVFQGVLGIISCIGVRI